MKICCKVYIKRQNLNIEPTIHPQQTQRIQVIYINDRDNDINRPTTISATHMIDELPTYEQAVGHK